MTDDETFAIPGMDAPAAPAPESPRPYLRHHLPDGTPLILTAGICADLASIFHDEFTSYIPHRFDEFATLVWMASRPPELRGALWRDRISTKDIRQFDPPLMSDYPALRATVSRWIDDTFRASEFDQIRMLALDLWTYHNSARVEVTEKKSPELMDQSAITQTH